MGRGKHFTPKEKSKVIKCKIVGQTHKVIAENIDRSLPGVGHIIENNREEIGFNRQKFIEKMRDMGITDKKMIAEYQRIAFESARIHGTQDDFIEIKDDPTRLKALNSLKDILGADAPKQQEIKQEIAFSAPEKDEVQGIRDRLGVAKLEAQAASV